jgi:outer membrane protein assembly factor BamB
MVSTGEIRFDVPAKEVSEIDVSGDWLASIEGGLLTVRTREEGKVRYQIASPEGEFGAPAIFPDGRIVVGSGSRLVRGVSKEGKFTWRFKVGARVKDRPLDFLDGKRVGIFSFEGVFYEVSLGGGDLRRRVLLTSRPFGAPWLAGGRVYAPVFEDEIAVIDAPTQKLLGRTRFGGGFVSAPLLVGGRILAEISGPRRIVALETVAATLPIP